MMRNFKGMVLKIITLMTGGILQLKKK